MKEIVKRLKPMLFGKELDQEMKVLPDYDENIRFQDEATRLLAISDLYQVYIPLQISREVYSRLYLSLVRSLKKKQTKIATEQYYKNLKHIKGEPYTGIVSCEDSFTILGAAGLGKSSAVTRSINVMGGNEVIEISNPYTNIIPVLVVQMAHDASVKGTLIEILRKIDEQIGTQYYMQAIRYHSTTDMLIGSVSQALLSHVGVMVLEEAQNLLNHHSNAQKLIGALTQLINNSSISILMIGVPECANFFRKEQHMARRALGLQYEAMKYDEEFYYFCSTLFSYQYVKNKTTIDDATVRWLFSHSNGNPSMIVTLIAMAQEIAILNGRETLDLISLGEAYVKRMEMLHGYVKENKAKKALVVKQEEFHLFEMDDEFVKPRSLGEIVAEAKKNNLNVVESLKAYITVEEIKV